MIIFQGLVLTLQLLDPNVDHKLCVKHLYENWKEKYPGEFVKGSLRVVARASTMLAYVRAMENWKKLNEEAWRNISRTLLRNVIGQPTTPLPIVIYRSITWERKSNIHSHWMTEYYRNKIIVKQRDIILRYKGDICPIWFNRNWRCVRRNLMSGHLYGVGMLIIQYLMSLKGQVYMWWTWPPNFVHEKDKVFLASHVAILVLACGITMQFLKTVWTIAIGKMRKSIFYILILVHYLIWF